MDQREHRRARGDAFQRGAGIRLAEPHEIGARHRQRVALDAELAVPVDEKRNARLLERAPHEPAAGVPAVVIAHHREHAVAGLHPFEDLQQGREDFTAVCHVISDECQ